MDLLTKNDLLSLINHKNELAVSIYIPTYIRGTDSLQNQIRFKNLLKRIKSEYTGEEYINLGLNNVLKQIKSFLDDYEFWQHQSEGLGMFLCEDFIKYYRIPINVDEFYSVGKNFYIVPLISYFNLKNDFYILYLSQKEITLYSGENFEINKVDVDELTEVTREELDNRDFQRQLQFFTGAGAGGRKDSMFYGTGAKDFQIHKYLLNFFNKIDKSIRKVLIDKRPLILAGADYIFPIYRQANRYPWIMDEVIHGNIKDLNKNEIIKRACNIINNHNRKEIENEYINLLELKNTDQNKCSSDLEVVINASYFGKIDELFLSAKNKIWGKYNDKSNKIELHDTPYLESDELLNVAAVNTLINGGDVYILDDGKYEKQIAARFRY